MRTNKNSISLLSYMLWWSCGKVIGEQEGAVSLEVQARPVQNTSMENSEQTSWFCLWSRAKGAKEMTGSFRTAHGRKPEIWEWSSHQSMNVLGVSFNVSFQKPGGRIGDYVGIWSLEILAYFYWQQWYLKAISVNFLKYVFSQRMELSVGLINYIKR